MPTYKIGYARVSTLQQDETLQLDALQKAAVDRLFVDRPQAPSPTGLASRVRWSAPNRATASSSGGSTDLAEASDT